MNARAVLPFVNPATGEQFGRVEVASPAEVQAAVREMRAAFPAWSSKPISERVAVLRELQRVLIDARDEISAVITQDTGKPRQDSLIEVFVTVDLLNDACRHAADWLRPERVTQGLYIFKQCYLERRPYGVAAVLGPWNYPLALALPGVFSALIAGNTVVFKPSEVTAATGALIERLIKRVPALAPYARVVHGDSSVGAALVGAPPDYIFITGSTGTGKKVMRVAAENITPLSCELGGKDPMLVLADADVAAAAEWGAWGAFFNAGQTCMSVERVYVVASVYDEFVRGAVAAAERLKVGHALDTDAPYQVGPITSPAQLELIEQHVNDALAKGARVLTGGRREGSFYLPTVLEDVNHGMLVMQEETFGPIMPIMRVADEAEAIRLANDNPYGLSASIWSRDLHHAKEVARQLQTGSAIINDTIAHFGVPQMPFGGMKASGFGRTHGREGLLQFTQPYAFATGQPPQPLDVATILRKPGHYRLGGALMRLVFGVTPEQRLEPVVELARRQVNRASFGRVAAGLGAAGLLAGAAFAFGLRRPRRRPG
jgi:acyl-CoA reductase-like NAD-dependent aldehyde dehydrogenase